MTDQQRRRKWDIPSGTESGTGEQQQTDNAGAVSSSPVAPTTTPPTHNPAISGTNTASAPTSGDDKANKIDAAKKVAERINATIAAIKPAATEVPKIITKEIDINDARNRFHLTKGQTHQEIRTKTGATVVCRGRYVKPGTEPPPGERPLHLFLSADSQQAIDEATKYIEELMNANPQGANAPQNLLTTKVFVPVENPDPAFHFAPKIIGHKGAYVKHITNQSGARVQLRGRGSNYLEGPEQKEADEPLNLFITCTNQKGLDLAKSLAENLVETVVKEYENWKASRQRPRGGYGHPPGGYPPMGGPPGAYGGYGYQGYGYGPYAPYGGYQQYGYPDYYGQQQYPQQPQQPLPPGMSPTDFVAPGQPAPPGAAPTYGTATAATPPPPGVPSPYSDSAQTGQYPQYPPYQSPTRQQIPKPTTPTPGQQQQQQQQQPTSTAPAGNKQIDPLDPLGGAGTGAPQPPSYDDYSQAHYSYDSYGGGKQQQRQQQPYGQYDGYGGAEVSPKGGRASDIRKQYAVNFRKASDQQSPGEEGPERRSPSTTATDKKRDYACANDYSGYNANYYNQQDQYQPSQQQYQHKKSRTDQQYQYDDSQYQKHYQQYQQQQEQQQPARPFWAPHPDQDAKQNKPRESKDSGKTPEMEAKYKQLMDDLFSK